MPGREIAALFINCNHKHAAGLHIICVIILVISIEKSIRYLELIDGRIEDESALQLWCRLIFLIQKLKNELQGYEHQQLS